MSFALIHEITYWVSVSDPSSSSWWNKRIPWNSTRSMWLCLRRGKRRLLDKPCDLGPLPIQTAAPLGACCGFLPLCTLVSFQKKSKRTRRWRALVCVPGWGWAAHQLRWAAHQARLFCAVTTCSWTTLSVRCPVALWLLGSLSAMPNTWYLYLEVVQYAWERKPINYFLLLNTLTMPVKLCFQAQSLDRTRGALQAGCPSLAAECSWKVWCLHCAWHHHMPAPGIFKLALT